MQYFGFNKFLIVEEEKGKSEIYSKRVRAGKRTYFFDVKTTRSNDYYLTITESKRKPKDDGYTYEKHKIFLYKEDFNKFVAAMNETVDHVKNELLPEVDFDQFDYEDQSESKSAVEATTPLEIESTEKVTSTELTWD